MLDNKTSPYDAYNYVVDFQDLNTDPEWERVCVFHRASTGRRRVKKIHPSCFGYVMDRTSSLSSGVSTSSSTSKVHQYSRDMCKTTL